MKHPRYCILAKEELYWKVAHYGMQMEDMEAQMDRLHKERPASNLQLFINIQEVNNDEARRRNKEKLKAALEKIKARKRQK